MKRACVLLLATACSTYRGAARDVSAERLASEPGWVFIRDVPYVAQQQETECGAAAIGMVIAYWTGSDGTASFAHFRPVSDRGIAAGRLRDYAREHGLASFVIEGKLEDISREIHAGRPVVVGLGKPQRNETVLYHYEVVVGFHPERKLVVTLDPEHGYRQTSLDMFFREWRLAGFVTLVVSSARRGVVVFVHDPDERRDQARCRRWLLG